MNQSIKSTIAIVSVILFLVLVYFLNTIVVYIIISAILALIGRPLMKLLNRVKIRNRQLPISFRSFLTLIVLLLFFASFFRLFAPLVIQEAKIISSIDYSEFSIGLNEPITDLQIWLKNNHLLSKDSSLENEILGVFNLTKVSNLLNSLIGFLGNGLISIFSIVFITFFFLKEKNIFENIIESLTPEKRKEQIGSAIQNTKRLLTRYFIGVIFQILIITIIVSTGLSLLDIENAFLIGFLAGIINVIPYVGPLIGALFGVVLGITTNLDLDFYTQLIPLSFKIISVFAIMQMIDNFIIQPIIFSNSVKAHPLEIFIIILSAGTIWGVTGMLVAIPFYTVIRVIAKEFLSEFKIVQILTKDI
jgi:predicted PurR-regulated permease PerM